jgi:hypothetical protein
MERPQNNQPEVPLCQPPQQDAAVQKEESLLELLANAEVPNLKIKAFNNISDLVQRASELQNLTDEDKEVATDLQALCNSLIKKYRKV